jgi:hypothetical protein
MSYSLKNESINVERVINLEQNLLNVDDHFEK